MNLSEIPVDDPRTAPPNAEAECGICGGTATRRGKVASGFRWKGVPRLCESWECRDCGTGGAVLRDEENGRPVRLPHVLTGSGFVEPDE